MKKTIGIVALITWVSLVTYSSLYTYMGIPGGRAMLWSILLGAVFVSSITIGIIHFVGPGKGKHPKK